MSSAWDGSGRSPSDHATRLREEAKALPPGASREKVLNRAGEAEAGAFESN